MDTHVSQNGAIEMLLARQSAQGLQDPAPDAVALDTILAAGLRAPDHGRLRPWRFIVIAGADRAAFADIAIAALQARQPDAPESEATRMRGKLMAAPLILGLGVQIVPDHKVPEIEQMMAVAAALGLHAPSRLAGFLYLGTPLAGPPIARPALADHRTDWHGVQSNVG